jgi:hypothetical protein
MFESSSENKLAILNLLNESFVIHYGFTQFKPKVLYLFFYKKYYIYIICLKIISINIESFFKSNKNRNKYTSSSSTGKISKLLGQVP